MLTLNPVYLIPPRKMTQDFKKMFGGINNPPVKSEPDETPQSEGRVIPPAVKESKKRITRRKRKAYKPRFFDLLEAQMKVTGCEVPDGVKKPEDMTLKFAHDYLERHGIILTSTIPQLKND